MASTRISVHCPACNAKINVPPAYIGKRGRCPACRTIFRVADPDIVDGTVVEEDDEIVDGALVDDTPLTLEGDVESARTDSSGRPVDAFGEPIAPKKKKRKKKKPAGPSLPSVSIDPGLVKLGVTIVMCLLGLMAGIWLVKMAGKTPPPDDIPDDQWRLVQGDGCRVKLPGDAKREEQNVAGVRFVMHQWSPDKHSVFGIGYTVGELPPHRRDLPIEDLLNDSCNGSIANLEQMGASESKRESIKLGEYPGKLLVADVLKGYGKMVSRVYVANGRLFMAMAGGAGVEEGQKNLQRFFDSFEITVAAEAKADKPAAPPANPGAPPAAAPAPVGEAVSVTDSIGRLVRGMHEYESSVGRFPPPAILSADGKPLLSWRVAVLPYVGHEDLYKRFKLDEPWDSPANLPLLAEMPAVYVSDADQKTATRIQVPTGKGTIFPEPGKGLSLVQIADGTSNTAAVVEARTSVAWTKPEDCPCGTDGPVPQLGREGKDFTIGLADGATRAFRAGTGEKVLRMYLTAAGGEVR